MSSLLGVGIEDFFKMVDTATIEYIKDYLPHIEKLKKIKQDKEIAR